MQFMQCVGFTTRWSYCVCKCNGSQLIRERCCKQDWWESIKSDSIHPLTLELKLQLAGSNNLQSIQFSVIPTATEPLTSVKHREHLHSFNQGHFFFYLFFTNYSNFIFHVFPFYCCIYMNFLLSMKVFISCVLPCADVVFHSYWRSRTDCPLGTKKVLNLNFIIIIFF